MRRKSTILLGAMALTLVACAKDDTPGTTVSTDTLPPAAAPASGTDADMQRVLDALAAKGGTAIETLAPGEARKQPTPTDAVMDVLKADGRSTSPDSLVPGVTHTDRTIAGAAGQIPARIYTPAGNGPFPVILYFHGGGWVIGSKDVYDGGARGVAKAANAVVVSIDYRLAPENKVPAQHDDALAAYRWVLSNAASIKGDPKKIALAGESAGGNLAVATAVAARDAKLQMPTHVLSVYPIAQNDTTTASYTQYATAKPLNRPMMNWFASHTIRTPADLQDPRINLVAANLAGLPATTIITAEIDPLKTDGEMLLSALQKAGVAVEHRHFVGVTHEFFGMAAVVAKAREAQEYAGQRLKASFQ
ncbi:MAG: alpha/beta hydrolase [Longimicrobiales bacterium]